VIVRTVRILSRRWPTAQTEGCSDWSQKTGKHFFRQSYFCAWNRKDYVFKNIIFIPRFMPKYLSWYTASSISSIKSSNEMNGETKNKRST